MENLENLQIVLDELNSDLLHPELIEDNKKPFTHDNELYQARMPTQLELTEANNARNRRFYELLKETDDKGNPVYLSEVNLKKLLKEAQNIDIDEMDKELEVLKNELLQAYVSLSKCKDGEDKYIEKYRSQINEIKQKRQLLLLNKTAYIAPAIELQSQDAFYKTLSMLCTEKVSEEQKDDETIVRYEKVWKNKDEYNNDNSVLPNKALGHFVELYINV